ncbi:hypothetical protein D3C78_976930 [compost metagenome]
MRGLAVGADRQRQFGVTGRFFLQGFGQRRQIALGQQVVVQRIDAIGADGDFQLLELAVGCRRTADRLRQFDPQLGFAGKGGGHDKKQQQDEHDVDQ